MISLKEKEVKQVIALLNHLYNMQSSNKLKDFVEHLQSEFEEQRMMTKEETGEMVDWAIKHVK